MNRDNWRTPPHILALVSEFFGEDWHDPCPANHNIDAFSYEWPNKCYINPPFSEYLKWAKYGLQQKMEQIWMCHHDHSTERFQLLAENASLCLLYNRVRFLHPETLEPGTRPEKPATLIYRGEREHMFKEVFSSLGHVVR